MWSTLKATVRSLVRTPSIMIWTALFPIILSTIFLFMFQSLSNSGTLAPTRVATVRDAAWDSSGFSQVVESLSEPGDDQLLEPVQVTTASEGEELLDARDVAGVYAVDADGTPSLLTREQDGWTETNDQQTGSSILEAVASAYAQSTEFVAQVGAERPEALSDPSAVDAALAIRAQVERVSLTRATPDQTVRYYYALLGMAALFCAYLAAHAVCQAQPNTSPLGARRAVAGTSRGAQLVGALLGSWLVSLACLGVAFVYMRFVVGIDFAGREALCLVGLGGASLLATAIGALVGAVPLRGGTAVRMSIITGLSSILSLFAGLYGEPTMRLADEVARAVPAEPWLNPARLVSDLFYSLYYYDSLGPFFARLAVCAAMAALLLAAATALFRRQRHEHL